MSLKGECVVFSGFRDARLEKLVRSLGGEYKPSISKAVTMVIVKDSSILSTNKVKAAQSRGLRVLTRQEFEENPAAVYSEMNSALNISLSEVVDWKAAIPSISLRCISTSGPKSVALADSRLGGTLPMPASASWPRAGRVPMQFVAQLRMSTISPHAPVGLLPRTGRLAFFRAADYFGEGQMSSDSDSDSVINERFAEGRHRGRCSGSAIQYFAEDDKLGATACPADLPTDAVLPLYLLVAAATASEPPSHSSSSSAASNASAATPLLTMFGPPPDATQCLLAQRRSDAEGPTWIRLLSVALPPADGRPACVLEYCMPVDSLARRRYADHAMLYIPRGGYVVQ